MFLRTIPHTSMCNHFRGEAHLPKRDGYNIQHPNAGVYPRFVLCVSHGLLDTVVTIAEQDASTVDDALNLWVEANKATYAYYKWGWSDGPVFVKE